MHLLPKKSCMFKWTQTVLQPAVSHSREPQFMTAKPDQSVVRPFSFVVQRCPMEIRWEPIKPCISFVVVSLTLYYILVETSWISLGMIYDPFNLFNSALLLLPALATTDTRDEIQQHIFELCFGFARIRCFLPDSKRQLAEFPLF